MGTLSSTRMLRRRPGSAFQPGFGDVELPMSKR
jgi:hypothetical protein